MLNRLTTHKIRPEHLDRQALIYVRQSTLAQVLENTASTARQYDLAQRALDLGWAREQIIVIDQQDDLAPGVADPFVPGRRAA